MASIFKPIPDLRGREPSGLGQLLLLGRVGIGVLEVPLPEEAPGPLLEAVGLLLAVPNRPGQRELFPHSILIHRPERPAPELLSLLVVGLEPHGLELPVGVFGELVVLQDGVHLAEVVAVEGDDGPGPEDGLVLVELADVGVGDREGPEEPGEALDVPVFLEGLADGGHLGDGEI